MGIHPEANQLVIKNSFLEYVGDRKDSMTDDCLTRQRSQTDQPSFMNNLCYSEVREALHGSNSSSTGSHIGDSSSGGEHDPLEPIAAEPAAMMPATPDSTPLHCPTARHVPGWLQEEWGTEALLPEAFLAAPQSMSAYGHWNDQNAAGDWASHRSSDAVGSSCQWNGQPARGVGVAVAVGARYDLPCAPTGYEVPCPPTWNVQRPTMPQVYLPMGNNARYTEPRFQAQPAVLPGAMRDPRAIMETRTTVMLRDLPEAYSRTDLLNLLDAHGFFGRFDFIYLPVDFKHQRNLGYALVNCVSPVDALRFTTHFQGFSNWGIMSDRVGSVGWCSPQQGLEAHVERYRNSPVMHQSVPEEWRPMLLSCGVPIPFPAPTAPIKAPKVKGQQPSASNAGGICAPFSPTSGTRLKSYRTPA
jgi:hypothetical protein